MALPCKEGKQEVGQNPINCLFGFVPVFQWEKNPIEYILPGKYFF